MKLSNEQYDFWKKIAQIWIPAISALYFGLAKIWNLPLASEITGTLAVLDTFLGTILEISTANYNRDLIIGEEPFDHSKEVG